MERQINYTRWIEADTSEGTQFIEFDVVFTSQNQKTSNPSYSDIKDYLTVSSKDDVYGISILDGYGARLSMPGYMDCTEWSVYDTEKEANEHLESLELSD